MEEQNSKNMHEEQDEMQSVVSESSLMKILPVVLAVLITAVIVGGGMYWWQSAQVTTSDDVQMTQEVSNQDESEMTQETSNEPAVSENVVVDNAVVKYNCEQSGGAYSNGVCSCSESEYEESTGYCITDFGTPGGDLHEQEAKLQELVILKKTIVTYNCEQSGGEFSDDSCSCPNEDGEQLEYDSQTGYCMTSFGIPGGELGDTEQKLQELEMLKNQ